MSYLPERCLLAAILPTSDVSLRNVTSMTCLVTRASFRVPFVEPWRRRWQSQSTVLASLVAQVRGMMFYGFQMYGAREGEQVVHPPSSSVEEQLHRIGSEKNRLW